jgi:sugar/nucleoside kinase (ribokinase family)
MEKKYNIVGIGNAVVDTICLVEEHILSDFNLTKGSMFLIDEANAKRLEPLKYEEIKSGGSIANSVATMAMLGAKTALIGKVGKDKFGDIFSNDLKQIGCDFICKKKNKSGSTARSYVLVTPDGERTMCTYLGLASQISDEIDDEVIANSEILYLEGYLWDDHETIMALRHAVQVAKENETKVVFSLSDGFCVERHRSEFLNMFSNFDILFANEMEMEFLIGKDFADNDYQKVKNEIMMRNLEMTVVMTMGEKGAMVFSDGEAYHIPAEKCEKVVDATGAGDSFAAGFLYGISNGFNVSEAAMLGNVLAGGVIEKIGARLTQEKLLELMN